ncbi:carboxymuconolactone decarboxylase family protein [Methanobacterium sp.]|uniref:carboxymuconolactone decarboxylase family protein n=1 Tax=Methanobacterium sp. TaxID=2164 RepID=UPI002ABC284B|nr:carboxymuconolactone decarboxylase family protein [Methanobacterium sp.]MDY9924035.1 carboxymuconolactone decarboxylase family protein [Methanobacterium sp.]
MEEKARPNRFTEVLGEDVDSAFKKLASEILKDGALTLKEKSLIALACAVAVKCDPCTRAHKKQALKTGATQEEIMEAAAVAGLVRMGSGFNTAYALLDDHEPGNKLRFKPPVNEITKNNDKSDGFKTLEREPDGYLNSILEKGSSNENPK